MALSRAGAHRAPDRMPMQHAGQRHRAARSRSHKALRLRHVRGHGKTLSAHKARIMLNEGDYSSPKQKHFFQAVAHGWKPTGRAA